MKHTAFSGTLSVRYRGLCPYEEAYELQQSLHQQRLKEHIPDTLLLLEHPPVFTKGKYASDSDFLTAPHLLQEQGFAIADTDRGGKITYHGPGQLVGYCIFHLYDQLRALRAFIHSIEEVCILSLQNFGISASRKQQYPGIWVEDKKIIALGIAVPKGVSMHGFAYNVSPDLSHYRHIVPCGIREYGITSLEELCNKKISVSTVIPHIMHAFTQVFHYDNAQYSEYEKK